MDVQGSDQLPDQAATMLDELAENDDEENIVLLKAVSPRNVKGMTMDERHNHMVSRLRNLLAVRATLADNIIYPFL